jgi:predicted PurR-regulated permease PerM
MTSAPDDRFRKGFLILLVVAISAAFLAMIEGFLMTILVAAIFSGLLHPIYTSLVGRVGGRRPLASVATILLGLVLIGGPLLIVVGLVTSEALRVSDNVAPRVKELINEPTALAHLMERIPFYDRIEPYRAQILQKAGELVGSLGSFLVSSLSDTTKGTVNFIFQFFMFLYTMFFLLMDGPQMLRTLLKHLPLQDHEQERMLEKFVSVTRATLRGTLVIGIIQGSLGGLAFWAVGIDGAMFWGTIMVVLSVLPVVGGALVWVPAAIVLALTGHFVQAIGLTLFCSVVVGSIDNLLRPWLVGRDTQMHDLMILFSTLGGIAFFGPIGFIVGPILAALFVTSWDIFADAFRDSLPGTSPLVLSDGVTPSDASERVAKA